MDDKQIIEALKNEIDFLQREVDRHREQNKRLVEFIFKIKNNELRH